MKKTKITSVILVLIFGPFGMFYWGLRSGLASLLGMVMFVIFTTMFGFDVNMLYQALIRIVFLIINNKILKMTDTEKQTISTLDFKGFAYLTWMVILNFLIYGFGGYVIWSVFNRLFH